jgi:hypothetical protein
VIATLYGCLRRRQYTGWIHFYSEDGTNKFISAVLHYNSETAVIIPFPQHPRTTDGNSLLERSRRWIKAF